MTKPDQPHITVSSGLRGFYAVHIARDEGGLWEPVETAPLAHPTFEAAEIDARQWAEMEGLPYHRPNSDKPLTFFHANPIIPNGQMALVMLTESGPDTIWIGPTAEVPAEALANADEAHVSPTTYTQLAAKLAATGKGVPFH